MQTQTFQNLSQFQTLQALVNRRLPNGTEIDQETAIQSLVRFTPIVTQINESNKKILKDLFPIKPNDHFLLEWEKEIKEIDRLLDTAEKMFMKDLLSRLQ